MELRNEKMYVYDIQDICIKMNTKEENDKSKNKVINKYVKKLLKKNLKEKEIRIIIYNLERELKKIGSNESFEERCINEFWKDPNHPERLKILESITKNAMNKKVAYKILYDFLVEIRRKYPNITNVSDNSPYDLARISFELNKYGYKGLEYIGGDYNGFGLDTEDFIKGISFAKKWDENFYKKEIKFEEKFKSYIDSMKEWIKKRTVVPFEEHSGTYDAVKIGFEYLLIKNYI